MTRPDLTVLAVRYCADVPAVTEFFETIGLTRKISTEGDGFVVLVAGDGLLMLHDQSNAQTGVAAGHTTLDFEAADLDATYDALSRLDLDPIRWDESYGRHLGLRDPRGEGIWINEPQQDLYGGFQAHPPQPNDLNLMAIRYSTDFATDAAFYAKLGFTARPTASEHFAPLQGDGSSHGVVGLHPPNGELLVGPSSPENPVSPATLISVSLETHEPLDALLARLTALGLTATFEDGPAPNVLVTDPEGVELQIHIAP